MGSTSLGMPALPPRTAQPTWKQAWDSALYGQSGHLRHHPVSLTRDRAELVDFLVPRMSGNEPAVLLGAAGEIAPQLRTLLTGAPLPPHVPTRVRLLHTPPYWPSHVPAPF